jgi:acylphosphatase
VGAVALNVHGIVRATQDIDIFVQPEQQNVERLKKALRAVWDDPEIEGIRYEELAGEYATIRYLPPDEDLVIDIITQLGEAFRFDDLAAETVTWNGVSVRVATAQTLYQMKKGTLRPVDRADAAELKGRFNLKEN